MMSYDKRRKSINFYTTGRQPSADEFAQISEWIQKNKAKQKVIKQKKVHEENILHNEHASANKLI